MVDTNHESGPENMPVSLPPRSFDLDELQAKFDSTAGKLKDGADAQKAMQSAVLDLVGDDQPDVYLNPSEIPGMLVVDVLNPITDAVHRTQVYVPDGAKPSQIKALESASTDTGKVLDLKGKAVDTPAEPIALDPAAAAATTSGN